MGVKEQYRDYVMTGFVKRVEPVVADHGDGALLYDADGTEYIDCFAGISVTNAGHGNQKILAAAKAQADKLVHACSYVYDADGTEYIDCFAGISVTNAGHGNQKILAAAKAQADKLVHACSYVYHVE